MVVSLEIPDQLEREIDEEIREGVYASKSEFIRDAIRRLLEERETVEYRRHLMERGDEPDQHATGPSKRMRKNLKRTFE